MTKKLMRQWLIAGNGRAIVWIKEHGDAGYEDLIVQTCLYNRIADFQCNDGYDWFYAELFAVAGRTEYYVARLLAAYYGVREFRYRERFAALIGELASRGNEPCRQFIADNWRRDLEKLQTELTEQHVRLTKKKGYEEVLEFVGTTRKRSIRHESTYWSIRYAGEKALGEKAAKKILDRFVKKHPCLKPFEPTQDSCGQSKAIDVEMMSVEELTNHTKRIYPWGVRRLFHKASDKARAKALSIAESELPAMTRVKFLAAFYHESYPGDLEKVIDLIDDEEVQFYASYSLAKTKDERLRQKALHLLQEFRKRRFGMALLVSNFKSGDESVIMQMIHEDRHSPDFEIVYYRLSQLIKGNPRGKWGPVALFAAEHVPCGICRHSLYELAAKYRMLKRKDYEAMLYDSDERTRKWAKKRLRAHRS